MNKEQMVEEITSLKKRLLELEGAVGNPVDEWKPDSILDLEDGDEYLCIERDGNIEEYIWDCSNVDFDPRDQGNAFLLSERKKAEELVEHRRCRTLFVKLLAEKNNGWVPNFNGNQYNYCITYENGNETCIDHFCTQQFQPDEFYARNAENLKSVHQELGDDVVRKAILAR